MQPELSKSVSQSLMLKPHDIQKMSERQREVIPLEAKAVLVWVLVPVSHAA